MSLVTIHLEPGQTLQDLIREVQALTGDRHVRTVAGRAGVLVEAQVAYWYLERRYGYQGLPVGESVGTAVVVELELETAPEPTPAPVAAKKAPAKKAAKAAPKSEEV